MGMGYRLGNRVVIQNPTPYPWVKETDVLRYLLRSKDARDLLFILAENARYFPRQVVCLDHPLFTVPLVLLWEMTDEQFRRLIGGRLMALLCPT